MISPDGKPYAFGICLQNQQSVSLLMAEIRQTHQLRLVVYLIIYRCLYIPGGWEWDFFHPQNHCKCPPEIFTPKKKNIGESSDSKPDKKQLKFKYR